MSGGHREFNVLRSKNGPVIRGWSLENRDRKDVILSLGSQAGRIFNIHIGNAGRELLTDPEDHKPLTSVDITILYVPSAPSQTRLITKSVTIQSHRIRPNRAFYREASYRFQGDTTLEVSNGFRAYGYYGVMTDEMAASLINTIDSLIPGATSHILQNRLSTTPETATPKTLPPARRRPPGR